MRASQCVKAARCSNPLTDKLRPSSGKEAVCTCCTGSAFRRDDSYSLSWLSSAKCARSKQQELNFATPAAPFECLADPSDLSMKGHAGQRKGT